jgi:hypothetical protein
MSIGRNVVLVGLARVMGGGPQFHLRFIVVPDKPELACPLFGVQISWRVALLG